ncbi:MAG: bifunctional 3,4-dihydroxy-2-butanone 4-phosphate synthase/GTP cyclohydrolase II [candidate division Zixibacteria bacterium RBG_16_53_22]|nr:MAG: bifunctional 3,4-dihydroxy-2-butanone 4-phosphate synthase/GTP cyclohydrolase II [candidate division Zixibacteria bacterium RBG_16_53_22]
MSEFSKVDRAIEAIKAGNMIIVVDDEGRENEGDLVMAAQFITSEKVNFLTKYGRGLICVPMPFERLQRLELAPMVQVNTALHGTRFTVSVDAVKGTTTGISAHDRAATIKALADQATKPEDLGRPGHIFPIQAMPGGVLTRAGHTEATVDLCRLAGLEPYGVLCEILDDDGSMARRSKLLQLAKDHDLPIVSVEELIKYRRINEKLVERVVSVDFPTRHGDFKLHLYRSSVDDHHHLAIEKGEVSGKRDVMVRVHSSCLTGDVFGSCRCDCGDQLAAAMELIENERLGVVLYMRQEGRGIGLANKILAYKLQDEGRDTVEANVELGFPADLRDYGIGAQILADLGLTTIRLITNNPKKIVGLEGYNLKVTGRVPLQIPPNQHNARYLETKRDKLGHLIDILDDGSLKKIK